MKKQISLLAILLLGLVTTAWAASAFTVEVSIGSADAEPSLVFGQADTAVEKPYPPFSSMFGVKDVYLANPKNLGVTEAGVDGDLARLGTDIRTLSDDNQWMIVANSDAKLYFDKEGEVELKIFASEEGATAEDLGDSYSVKAGVDYTIFASDATKQTTATRAVAKSDTVTVNLEYDELQKLYGGESDDRTVDSADTFVLTPVGGYGTPIYLFVRNGVKFVSLADGSEVSEQPSGWILVFHEEVSSTEYVEDAGLKMKFASTVTELAVRVVADKGSYKDVSVNVLDANGQTLQVQYALHILSNGTLDFDGDETVDINDAMYLLNFQEAGCPGEDDPFFTIDDLRASTEVTDETRLNTALETLRGMETALDFDEDETVDINDAMYLLNFQEAGCPGEDDPFFTIDDLRASTEVTDETRLNTALENLRNYAPASDN